VVEEEEHKCKENNEWFSPKIYATLYESSNIKSWSIEAGDGYHDIWLNNCPFCGVKLE
jgi:hypothetical protein